MLSFEPNKPLIKLVVTLIVLAIVLCTFLSWRAEQNAIVDAVTADIDESGLVQVSLSPVHTKVKGHFYFATILDSSGNVTLYAVQYKSRNNITFNKLGEFK